MGADGTFYLMAYSSKHKHEMETKLEATTWKGAMDEAVGVKDHLQRKPEDTYGFDEFRIITR
jgi:hypothetical protein